MRVQPWTSRSITDLLSTLGYAHLAACPDPLRSKSQLSQAEYSPTLTEARMVKSTLALRMHEVVVYWEAKISLVIGINQTNHSTN